MRAPRLPALLPILLLAACARSATLEGEVRWERPPDVPAARVTVRLVPESEAFLREWSAAVEAFQTALRPAQEQQRAAERLAERARQAWDRAVATSGTSGVGLSQWNRSAAGRRWERALWREVRRTSRLAAAARKRLEALAAEHGAQAELLLLRHATREVVTDAEGRYILTGLPAGKVHLYARLPVGERGLVWLRAMELRPGRHRLDLSEQTAGGWPFAPA